MAITHPFVSAVADGSDATLVRPSNWNAAHTIADDTITSAMMAASSVNLATDTVTGILPTANGGTGIAFFTAAGPTVARVYTFPDSAATILYSGGALGTPSSGTLTNATGLPEGGLSLTDITTANASATAHGFVPKWPNNTTTFFRGDGTYAAPSANSGPTFPGGIPLTGVSYPAVRGNNLSTGTTDLYTVPANMRLAIFSANGYNQSAGNITWSLSVKVGSIYYRLTSNITTSTVTTSAFVGIGYIAEAGEIIAAVSATNNGLNTNVRAVLFDNSISIKSAKLTTLAAGDNTLYTVPASKTATMLNLNLAVDGASSQCLMASNDSGATRTVDWHIVPSGQAVGANYLIVNNASALNAAKTNFNGGGSLSTGDFINFNTDASTADQMAWISVMEI